MSLKKKYLELQNTYFVNFSKKINEPQEILEKDKKTFKPIQGQSKNKETYKDDNAKNELIKKLLKINSAQAKNWKFFLV